MRGDALRRYNRRVQMVFQDPYGSLNPRMTVGEMLGEALRVHNLVSAERRAARIAELLELVRLPANAIARLAALRGQSVPEIGTTTFRPPYTPIAIGAVTGRHVGLHFSPIRLTPMHQRHLADGAVMTQAGAWMRPWYYPRSGETIRAASRGEMPKNSGSKPSMPSRNPPKRV